MKLIKQLVTVSSPNDNNIFFWTTILVYIILLFLRAVIGLNIPNIILVAYPSILFFIFNTSQGIAFASVFALLGTGVQIAIVITFAITAFIIKNYRTIKFTKLHIPLIFLMIWELSHIFIEPSSIVEYVRYLTVFAYVGLIVLYKGDRINNDLVLKAFIFFCFSVSSIILLQTLVIMNVSLIGFLSSGFRLGYGYLLSNSNHWLLSYDPNFFAQNSAIAISGSIILIHKGHSKLTFGLAIIFFLIFGLLSLSKTFPLIVFTILLYSFISVLVINRRNVLRIISGTILLIFITYLFFTALNQLFPDVINNLLLRFSEGNLTTGRADSFSMYLDYLLSDWRVLFFGLGLQNIGTKTGLMGSPHSSIIELIISWGMIGLFTIVLIFYFAVGVAKHNSKNSISIISYLPLWVVIFMSQTTPFFTIRDRVLLILLVFIAMNVRERAKM